MIVGNDAYGNYVHDDIERIRYYFPFSQQFIEDALGNTDDGIRLNGNNRKHIILFTAYISIFTAENFPVELLNYMLQNNYNQFRDNGLIEFVKGIFGEPFYYNLYEFIPVNFRIILASDIVNHNIRGLDEYFNLYQFCYNEFMNNLLLNSINLG